jgi:hypothetical protein
LPLTDRLAVRRTGAADVVGGACVVALGVVALGVAVPDEVVVVGATAGPPATSSP